MKVNVEYCVRYVKEIEMTPEEYCNSRANFEESGLFPKDSYAKAITITDKKSVQELEDYFWEKG